MQQDFWINNSPSGEFGCRLLQSWSVKDAALSPTFLQGKSCTTFTAFGSTIGLKTISLPVHIYGSSPRDALQKRSLLTSALMQNIVNLQMPDGFLYRAALSNSGSCQALTQDGCILSCQYELTGMQCDPLQQITTHGNFFVQGTHPFMDCCIICIVGKAAQRYTMAGITWQNVQTGDVLIIDGLKKQVLKNGSNAALDNDLTQWVKLHPGENHLTAPDPLTIEYYPTYL